MAFPWINIAAFLGLFALAGLALLLARRSATRRRRKLMARPFPDEWETILENDFPLYRLLPPGQSDRLRKYIQVFLAEKSFEGCGGLELTDRIRVLIAAQACLLLLNGKGNFYPNLRSILVYPAAYRNRPATLFSSEHDRSDEGEFAGESWTTGSVILSWHDVKHGVSKRKDGYNVVLHEFAHQLDQLNGVADGAPVLHHRSSYRTWSKILGTAYDQFQENLRRGRRTVFDEYGASGPEEFFAVATETFFEKPRQLKEAHPELYAEFRAFYVLDPASWKKP